MPLAYRTVAWHGMDVKDKHTGREMEVIVPSSQFLQLSDIHTFSC